MAYSEKIFNLRKKRGWSQERVAEELGVSRQSVSKWESGAAMPDLNRLTQLSKLFGTTLDELVNDEALPDDQDEPVKGVDLTDISAEPEPVPVLTAQTKPKRRGLLIALTVLILVGIGIAVASFFIRSPNYTNAQSIKAYLDESIDLHMPYAQVNLNYLEADTLRKQMEDAGLQVNVSDKILEEGIQLYIADYFEQFADYGLTYDTGTQMLYHKNEPVLYFDDYDMEGSLTQVSWYSWADDPSDDWPVIIVERNVRGAIKSVENINEYD